MKGDSPRPIADGRQHLTNEEIIEKELKYYDFRNKSTQSWNYAMNIDSIEYRRRNGLVVPVAMIELTVAAMPIRKPDSYIHFIQRRYETQTLQGKALIEFSKRMCCPLFFVAADPDMSRFVVWDMNDPGWIPTGDAVIRVMKPDEYISWIEKF